MIEKQLTKRLKTLATLSEAVIAMKSLAAHHFLQARRSLVETRSYRETVDQIIASIGMTNGKTTRRGPRGLIVVSSDLGLCGDYNSRLLESVVEEIQSTDATRVYMVGKRGQQWLKKHSLLADRCYSGPASVDGLPGQLLTIAEEVIGDYASSRISRLDIWSARFTGAGKFDVGLTHLLPLSRLTHQSSSPESRPIVPAVTAYQSPEHLWNIALREYLYITLYQLLLDALASEHGMRLVAAESARKWIDEARESVKRKRSAIRREVSTQEVLDIVSASRVQRRERR